MTTGGQLLHVDGLSIDFETPEGPVHALRGIDLSVEAGESVGIVGESGSGKTTLAFAIMRHLASNATRRGGHIRFRDEDLATLPAQDLRRIRGRHIAMVYQDPEASLNPALTVGEQMVEAVALHRELRYDDARDKAIELFEQVNLADPAAAMERYPHQMSGGQKQRVVIAMALSCDPDLLIMDEPTTALDVTTEAKILDLVEDLKTRLDTAIFYITHDLGVIARIADRVTVLYAGEIVEEGDVRSVFESSAHPYTVGLMNCVPSLWAGGGGRLPDIPGRIPALTRYPEGCVFADRCPFAQPRCHRTPLALEAVRPGHYSSCLRHDEIEDMASAYRQELGPAEAEAEAGTITHAPGAAPVLSVRDLVKHYREDSLWDRLVTGADNDIRAVDGISFEIHAKETVGLVGESGSGKTTVAETIVGLRSITRGAMEFEGTDIRHLGTEAADYRRKVRIVFQNPDSSLNPKKRIRNILGRPLELFNLVQTRAQKEQRLRELVEMVRLEASYLERYPGELSGGEKQRVAIARAFATNPELVICDEPTSALDVSVQASILNLLMDLQRRFHTSYLFISHDLSVVRHISDRVAIMYLGKLVEEGPTESVFTPPHHPYTESLLSAVPVPRPGAGTGGQIRLPGTVPSARNPPRGCVFHTRCPRKLGPICEDEVPPVRRRDQHKVVCQIPLDELQQEDVPNAAAEAEGGPHR